MLGAFVTEGFDPFGDAEVFWGSGFLDFSGFIGF